MERKLIEDEIDREVYRALARIMEHADAVVILASKEDRAVGETHFAQEARGNYFAANGMARCWLNQREYDDKKEPSDDAEGC